MPRDFADRALLRRNRRGALVSRLPATGSSLPGGSPVTVGIRKRINRAIKEGRPLLVRAIDNVPLRVATFDETVKALRSYDGRILIADALDTDGVSFGVLCVVKIWPVTEQTTLASNWARPRLVKRGK